MRLSVYIVLVIVITFLPSLFFLQILPHTPFCSSSNSWCLYFSLTFLNIAYLVHIVLPVCFQSWVFCTRQPVGLLFYGEDCLSHSQFPSLACGSCLLWVWFPNREGSETRWSWEDPQCCPATWKEGPVNTQPAKKLLLLLKTYIPRSPTYSSLYKHKHIQTPQGHVYFEAQLLVIAKRE